MATAREVALAAAGLTQVLDVVARRHLDGGLWVVPSEHAWSAALPYDCKFSGPTVTVPPLVRDLSEGAAHAATLRHVATSSLAPSSAAAAQVAQQGMASTRELAVALAARLEPGGRPARPATASVVRLRGWLSMVRGLRRQRIDEAVPPPATPGRGASSRSNREFSACGT